MLFADLVASTELVARQDPEITRRRVTSFFDGVSRCIETHGGTVEKFAGDAVMATFNVSGQSVDHTLQALRAAVAIVDKSGLAGLPVGAAVAVGPAVVGNLAESANLSVLGEVTNLASRLQGAAQAGEVMLSEEVYRRVKDWLEAQQIQAERVGLQLKGFEGPVFAYKVMTGTVAAATA